MRSLAEWIQVAGGPDDEQGPIGPHDDLAHDNALAGWSGLPYAELSVLLVHLRFLYLLHQTHHWIARGDAFYGDHQLFKLIYERTQEDIDDIAEKAVGLGCEQNVDLSQQLSQLFQLSKATCSPQTVPSSSGLSQASLAAEHAFLNVLDSMLDNLRQSGCATAGVENLLQQVADRHEKHVYLLRRRSSAAAMGM